MKNKFCCQGEAWLKKCPNLTYYNIYKDTKEMEEYIILGDENPMINVFQTRRVTRKILDQIQNQTIKHNWGCEMRELEEKFKELNK